MDDQPNPSARSESAPPPGESVGRAEPDGDEAAPAGPMTMSVLGGLFGVVILVTAPKFLADFLVFVGKPLPAVIVPFGLMLIFLGPLVAGIASGIVIARLLPPMKGFGSLVAVLGMVCCSALSYLMVFSGCAGLVK